MRKKQSYWKRLLMHIVDRKSTRLNSSHSQISYAVFCLKKKQNAHGKHAQTDQLLSDALLLSKPRGVIRLFADECVPIAHVFSDVLDLLLVSVVMLEVIR